MALMSGAIVAVMMTAVSAALAISHIGLNCRSLQVTDIFVFGSNLQGIHGAGAAKYALNHHGAKMGIGVGQQGTSYAIPTKSTPYKRLRIADIWDYVWEFMNWIDAHRNHTYLLTPIGCGLAGFKPEDMAKLFGKFKPPPNLKYPREFEPYLPFMADHPEFLANFPNFKPNL